MRVLLLSPLPPPSGGIARWTERYLAWCNGKIEVDVVNTALIGRRAGEAGVKKKIVDEFIRAVSIIRQTKKKLNNSYDIVHINTSCSKTGIIRDLICVMHANRKKVSVILHCHCNIEDQIGVGSIAPALFRQVVNRSNVILVLNKKSFNYVKSLSIKTVLTCPNFVQPNQIADLHTVNKEIRTIIYVGDIRFSKGSDDIYKVASYFPEKRFLLVGSVTDEMKQLNKPNNVELVGRLEAEDVEKQLIQADVFLFPSLTEGFSNALLEAMAAGLPCIATDVGSNADMIENQGGRIVNIHDVQGVVKAINEMESAEIRKRMSEWNIKKVMEYYEYNKVMHSIIDTYEATV